MDLTRILSGLNTVYSKAKSADKRILNAYMHPVDTIKGAGRRVVQVYQHPLDTIRGAGSRVLNVFRPTPPPPAPVRKPASKRVPAKGRRAAPRQSLSPVPGSSTSIPAPPPPDQSPDPVNVTVINATSSTSRGQLIAEITSGVIGAAAGFSIGRVIKKKMSRR